MNNRDTSSTTSVSEQNLITAPAKTSASEAKLTTGVGLFKSEGPEYTIRMLLGNTHSESKDIPELKPFSHFTLGCTSKDEAPQITIALDELAKYFEDSAEFQPETVINLGTQDKPLWALTLNLGSEEKNLRDLFSRLFDPMMSMERNGVRYLWNPTEKSQKKCPHLTIGPRKEDFQIAEKLLNSNCRFSFSRIDYKRVGPNDPHVSIELKSKTRIVNKM
jgi:hypothetical protein